MLLRSRHSAASEGTTRSTRWARYGSEVAVSEKNVKINNGGSLATFLRAIIDEGVKSALAQKALTEKEKQASMSGGDQGGGGNDVDSLFGGDSGGGDDTGGEED